MTVLNILGSWGAKDSPKLLSRPALGLLSLSFNDHRVISHDIRELCLRMHEKPDADPGF
jgi:hypothetical protein